MEVCVVQRAADHDEVDVALCRVGVFRYRAEHEGGFDLARVGIERFPVAVPSKPRSEARP